MTKPVLFHTTARLLLNMCRDKRQNVSKQWVSSDKHPVLFVCVVSGDKLRDEGKPETEAEEHKKNQMKTWQKQKSLIAGESWSFGPKPEFEAAAEVVQYLQSDQWGDPQWRGKKEVNEREGGILCWSPLSLFLSLRPTGCLLSLLNDSAWVWMFDWGSVGVCYACVCVWVCTPTLIREKALSNSFHPQLEIIEIPIQAGARWHRPLVFYVLQQGGDFHRHLSEYPTATLIH